MVKGKAKIDSNVSLAPPQPRSLRSSKRECPSDEIPEADDVEASHHQDTEGNATAADTTLLQCHQSPLQELTIVLTQQHEAAEQPGLSKQDHDTEENHAEVTNVMVKVFDEQEETSATNANNDSQQAGFRIHADKDANKTGKDNEEMPAEECKISPSQTCIDQLQALLPKSEEEDEAALEEQLHTKENSQCNFMKTHETCQEEPRNVSMSDENEITKEAGAGLPPKKKRRMGMCGLTERERSHFLQIQKRENGQNGSERVERHIAGNNNACLMAQEEITPPSSSSLCIPIGSVKIQDEAGIQLQSGHCGGDDRREADVQSQTSAVSDPRCSKGKSCEVEDDIVPGSQKTGDIKSDPPIEEEEEVILGHQEHQELGRGTAKIEAKNPQEQRKDRAVGSAAAVDQGPAISRYSSPTQNEETDNWGAIEDVFLQVNSMTATKGEEKEELTVDAGDGAKAGASSSHTHSGGVNTVELCKATVTTSGSDRKDSCGSDPSTLSAEPPHTRDTTDPFGSGYLDYVSDSQLNTVVLIEEDLESADHEDATDLICGLIRELSSLNRKVMAAHRELENLRRSSRSSRSSIR